jgi:hypothetical protein
VALGEHEPAIDALASSFAHGAQALGADVHYFWVPLRGHPRFEALLRSVGLPYRPTP